MFTPNESLPTKNFISKLTLDRQLSVFSKGLYRAQDIDAFSQRCRPVSPKGQLGDIPRLSGLDIAAKKQFKISKI